MNHHITTTSTTASATDRRGTPRPVVHRALATVTVLGLGLAALTGCAGQAGDTASSAGTESAVTGAAQATGLTLEDGWAKAADSGMTAVFGTLRNPTDKDITLTGAAVGSTAESVQLHETVTDAGSGSSSMHEKDGGFTVPAGGSFTLEPGGNHIMLMGLTCSLKAGADLTLRLDSDAGTQEVTVPVRDYSGAKESYAPGEGASGSAQPSASVGGMDMSTDVDESSHEHASHGGESGADGGSGHEGMTMDSPSSSALPECHAG